MGVGVDLPSVLVNNVDIGATLLDLAGLPPAPGMDGRSFATQLLPGAAPWARDRLVFEYWGMGYTMRGPCKNGTTPCPHGAEALEDAPSNSWAGLRIVNASHDLVYAEYRGTPKAPIEPASTNFTVAFDMSIDPWQLVNAAYNGSSSALPPAVLAALHDELWAIATCAGSVTTGGECP